MTEYLFCLFQSISTVKINFYSELSSIITTINIGIFFNSMFVISFIALLKFIFFSFVESKEKL